MGQPRQPQRRGWFDPQGFIPCHEALGELGDCRIVHPGLRTDPRRNRVRIRRRARPKSQVLPNLLFVIARGASCKVVRVALVCREIKGRRDMLHETARDLLPVLGKPPFPLAKFEENHESQAIHPALIREQTVFLGEHREMVCQVLGSKILAHSHLLGVGWARNEGFWPTVALPPDLAPWVGHDGATSRASINVPAPILRQGLWHRPEGAAYADWLCTGSHPRAELCTPVRRTGAEWLCQSVLRGCQRGESRPSGAHGSPRVSAGWRHPRRVAPGSLGAVAGAVAGLDAGLTQPAGGVP